MSICVIIGGNRGIGRALCELQLRRGDQVIASSRKPCPELVKLGVQVVDAIDTTQPESLLRLAAAIPAGGIDRLFINAGVLGRESLDALDDAAFARMQQQFETNALGPLRIVAALNNQLRQGSKVGILTSRMGSMGDNSSGGYYGYRMSKAAVNAAGRSLAIDLQPRGVAVVLLHPGFVRTEMTGGHGDITADVAAENLAARMDELTQASSGRFVHANGGELPW